MTGTREDGMTFQTRLTPDSCVTTLPSHAIRLKTMFFKLVVNKYVWEQYG